VLNPNFQDSQQERLIYLHVALHMPEQAFQNQPSIDVADTPSSSKPNWNSLLDTNDGQKDTHRPVKIVYWLPLIATELQKLFYCWVLSSEVFMGIVHYGQS